MKVRNIYIIRHGETYANLEGFVQSPETELTKTGIFQAQTLAARLQNISLDAVHASPYKRAIDTAQYVADVHNLQVNTIDLAREWDSPKELWGVNHREEVVSDFSKKIYEHWDEGTWKYNDEESSQEVVSRVKALLQYIRDETSGDIVLVTHGKSSRMIALMVATRSMDLTIYKESIRGSLKMANTAITHVTLDDQGTFVLRTFGDSTHLS